MNIRTGPKLGLLMIGSLLAACAEPAETRKMVVDQSLAVDREEGSPFRYNLAVTAVSGGEETNPLWTSEIGNAQFANALKQSLRTSKLSTDAPQNSRFEVSANLIKVEQPKSGKDMTVTTHATYRVTERRTGKTWFHMTIQTPYTATFDRAFSGVARLKLANEGAVRVNITTFIKQLILSKPPA